MKKVCVLLADGFEETEALAPLDMMRLILKNLTWLYYLEVCREH